MNGLYCPHCGSEDLTDDVQQTIEERVVGYTCAECGHFSSVDEITEAMNSDQDAHEAMLLRTWLDDLAGTEPEEG